MLGANALFYDVIIMQNVRPERLDEFVGQDKAVGILRVLINAAKKRNEPVCHILEEWC